MEHNLEVFRQLYGVSEIPFCIFEDRKMIMTLPEEASEVFTQRFVDICFTDHRIYSCQNTGPSVIMLNPGYYLAVIHLWENVYMILGPGVLSQYTWANIFPWLKAPLYEDNHKAMGQLLMRQKTTTSSQFYHTLSMILYLATGKIQESDTLKAFQGAQLPKRVQPFLAQYIFSAKESEGFHIPQSKEAELNKAMESGNIAMWNRAMLQRVPGRKGVLSQNQERQQRYMFVTTAAVFSRAAVRGGLDYEKACSMADIYCQRMDMLTNPNEIDQLQLQMGEDYCREVAALKLQQYSPVVRSCCEYIQLHSHEKIVFDDLARNCGMSVRRLSEKFKKEVGMSAVDYIHKVKMEEAELLLKHSNYSIGEISNYLGYSNQSYFISVFRQIYKKTPTQYRKSEA